MQTNDKFANDRGVHSDICNLSHFGIGEIDRKRYRFDYVNSNQIER